MPYVVQAFGGKRGRLLAAVNGALSAWHKGDFGAEAARWRDVVSMAVGPHPQRETRPLLPTDNGLQSGAIRGPLFEEATAGVGVRVTGYQNYCRRAARACVAATQSEGCVNSSADFPSAPVRLIQKRGSGLSTSSASPFNRRGI